MTRTSNRFRHQFPKSSVDVLTSPRVPRMRAVRVALRPKGHELKTLLDQVNEFNR